MKKARAGYFTMVTAVFLGGCIVCGAQIMPSGVRVGQPRTQDEIRDQQLRRDRANEARNQYDMRRLEQAAAASFRLPREKIGRLSAKEKKKIEALRTPDAEDLNTYSAFLSQPDTGIVRLLPDFNCESKYVVRVDGKCANSLPGASYHRFRNDSISGDILFMDGVLFAEGFFSNSIMTGLGDLPLDQITPTTGGMKFLTDFEPGRDIESAKKQYSEVLKGVKTDGHVYANRLLAVPGMTYALRIIAYKNGNNVVKRLNRYALLEIAPPPESQDMMFLALKEDNRVDLTVIFRIIRGGADGSITLIWKELGRKEAPELVFPDDKMLTDFK
jgi:hypothetical protein